ncbi:hypothetical protein [Methanococcus maripaludis]|uniref:Intracellular sulfur oxidation DsrE/DsrF family protein n=1 Tax=Methanococcus maripaludis TaxID=39152 RepID=A0A7J9PQK1_METMI|nr:hypothetical protein [Methanococcus maripaludis]MBA2864917.1 intracellular sulfur oxidation DsrE/DsrF family protein [Methanococcus maripaludis]
MDNNGNEGSKEAGSKFILYVYVLAISALAIIDFFYATFAITYELYLVFVLIAVILLSNSFESLEIVNCVKLKKESSDLKKENENLKQTILQNVSQNSNQIMALVSGMADPNLVSNNFNNLADKTVNNSQRVVNHNITADKTSNEELITKLTPVKSGTYEFIKELILGEYLNTHNISRNKLMNDVGIVPIGVHDPIGSPSEYFQGYISGEDYDRFIWIDIYADDPNINVILSNQIFSKLNSVYRYGLSKNKSVKVEYFLINRPDQNKYYNQNIEILKNNLLVPISNNLINIQLRTLTNEEISTLAKINETDNVTNE